MIAWTIYITFAGAVLCCFCRAVFPLDRAADDRRRIRIGLIAFFGTPIQICAVHHHRARSLGARARDELPSRGRRHQSHAGPGHRDCRGERSPFFLGRRSAAERVFLLAAPRGGGSYGVFLSADLFLLFVFYELVIVPKYFLIAIWGSTNKEYGAMKLTLYSFFGGALVFIGIIAAYVSGGRWT